MEKAIAIRLLTDTLQRPFDEAQFRQFARNLVNDLDESKAFQVQGNYIKDAYKRQVRQYKRIGQYVDPDGNTIDVLVVRLQQPTSLDRARTMQRNFIAQYLQDRDQKEAALVAYTTDGSPDWRFSLVRLDYRLEQQADGSYKPKKEVTAARRSSFLVGKTEPNHTAQQQLLPLLLNDRQNPTLDELEAAFNIESVTQEFFEQYKNLFLQVRDEVETLLQTDPVIATDFTQKQIDPANFAKKLLGQIVFLYFLQKKGWLGVEPGQPWGSGAKDFLRRLFQQGNVQYDNFFNDVLEPLFYHALAVDRGSEALYELPGCQQPCKIPFLNGGLFEPIGGYNWQTTNVLIANATIQNILDTFDLYNFTVREDEPLDKEVAVDPEMLGKVFENLLEVKDRKSKGAFYTPREIVHYMCQESLINYLDTTIHQVPRGDLERLIRQGERAIENDAQVVQKGSETATYQFQVPESVRTYAAEIDQALADIKICDPAIGSGAFPVGMMQEIVKVRGVLTTYLPDEGRSAYAFKRHAIQSSIYGVDIDPGAVDIAKLRLWLSLVVDEEDYESIKPLPNLDYKIVCGNSLLSVEKNLLNYQVFAELEQRKQEYFEETNPDRKTALRTTIQGLIQTITNQAEIFDFEVYFSEVFQQQGGFDVVIGNPPYVRQEQIKHLKDLLKPHYKSFTGTADLYVFFYEKGLNLLREQGVLTYISSNKWFRASYGKKLRQLIARETQLQQIIDFGDAPVFAAIAYPAIVITQKGKPSSPSTFSQPSSPNPFSLGEKGSQTDPVPLAPRTTADQNPVPLSPGRGARGEGFRALNWQSGQPISQFETVVQSQSFAMPQQALTAEGWQFADATALNLLEKLRNAGTPLGEYVNNRF
ncbi:MAG: Eco57I restriction-modification methylase domain-containing protein [Leptolyngbyaceae cyanobacterium HOT.MB2.61]|nr:Eco57I restriction-modification methylase domain-containing protein [Leptolyngbyaceae cyanobacterium HOT.MB2.61]